MLYTDLVQSYTPVGDAISFVLCICFLIMIGNALFFISDKNFFYFRHATWLIMVGSFTNVIFYCLCTMEKEHIFFIYLFRDIYHVCMMTTLLIFVIYLRNLVNAEGSKKMFVTYSTYIVTFVGMFLDIISPFTHFGFYRDADGFWYDSTYLKPYTFAYIETFFVMGFMLIIYRRRIVSQVQKTLVIMEGICIAIMIIENAYDSNTYTTFTYVIPMIAMLVLIHSMPLDTKTGTMNGEAFDSLLISLNRQKKKANYMVLELDIDADKEVPVELGKVMYNFWQDHFKKAILFNIRPNLYVLAIVDKNLKDDVDKINDLVERVFPQYYKVFGFDYWIQIYTEIDFIENKEEMVRDIDLIKRKMDRNSIINLDQAKLDELKKTKVVLKHLMDIKAHENLEDERILVYCQPVKNVKTGRFDTAEALMRMTIPEYGMIFPDMFIPLAEESGAIHTLSRIILNKTCAEIKKIIAEGYHLERVSINFSIVELRSDTFCDEVLSLIKRNDIDYSHVAIELTESTNDEDFKLLYDRVHQLKEYGIRFYLDDFGTGYSNFDKILSLNLDIVKFDRSLLLMADDKNVKFTLKHFSQAFEDLEYKILFEGVETENQEALCESCHADYLQGFMFSRPIPIAELKNFLTKEDEIAV